MPRCIVIDPKAETIKPLSVTIRSGDPDEVFGLLLGGNTSVSRLCGNSCRCGIRLVALSEVSHENGFFLCKSIEQVVSGKAVVCKIDEGTKKLIDLNTPVADARDLIRFLLDCRLLGFHTRRELFSFDTLLVVQDTREPIYSHNFEPLVVKEFTP